MQVYKLNGVSPGGAHEPDHCFVFRDRRIDRYLNGRRSCGWLRTWLVLQWATLCAAGRTRVPARVPARLRGSRTMGIRDRPISPRSPWQNAYVERLIATLRRECLDHVLIYGERHLRRVLTLYSLYYNETRTHLGLGKDAPLRRSVQRSGTIVTTPILSGLHHRYARI